MSLLLDEVALAALRLAEAGVESPRADAELIAASVHNVRRGELHTVPDAAFDARFWADIARRAAREPLQHITGRAHFRYLELDVGPGVFVPRPETEVMTGWAIDKLRDMDVAEPVVADLGTGSGAIALAIGQEVPRARVHAIEADPLARAWAERNITSYVQSAPYTAGRIMLHPGDFGDALSELDGTVDLVVSNPPYIPVGAYVEPEVSEYDPPAALWSGTDGLQAIRSVERTARRLLRPGGLLAVEHGFQQGAAVYWVFPEESGWQDTRNHKDLTRRDRFVTATWSGGPLADGRIEGWFGTRMTAVRRSAPVDSIAVSTKGPEGTGTVAALLAPQLRSGDVVLLKGGLATGKTTFVKAVAAALGSPAVVTSPTFTLAHFYPLGHGTILHVDAYRLSGILEYRDLGLDDYLEDSIALIEWGEKIAADFSCHLMVEFQGDPSAPDLRVIAFSSGCPRWSPVIDALRSAS